MAFPQEARLGACRGLRELYSWDSLFPFYFMGYCAVFISYVPAMLKITVTFVCSIEQK